MAILKRFEIWLLLFLVIGIVVFVTKKGEEPQVPITTTQPEKQTLVQVTKEKPTSENVEPDQKTGENPELSSKEEPTLLRVKNVVSTDTGNGHIVDLELTGRSGTEKEVLLDAAQLTVRTPAGEEVPRFFTPFSEEPILDPKEDTLFSVKFWVVDTPESLWVEYRDQRIKADLPR